jgi:hypothetical protein
MSSNINPNNIDGAYPVAGQDNNSQGFRDNFTNTKTNFQYAADEITDLQSKAVLKSALSGTTLNNDMNGSVLSNATVQDIAQTRVALGSLSGSVTVNYASGSYQTVTTSGSISLAFSNFPPAGSAGTVIVRVTVASTAHTMTLPSAVGNGSSAASVLGIQGIASNVITFAETGTYEFQFDTDDNGSTIYVSELTRPRNRYTNPLFLAVPNTFAGTGNVSLTSTTTLFSSNAAVTGNLLAGQVGQIKILAYSNVSVGNTQITVTNAAWGGSNIANLSAVGSACTLQWVGAKWFVIGNNGVTFS